MTRTEEAMLSRQNMSSYKTIYVEGNLDLSMIESFLISKDILNVRVYRIIADRTKFDCNGFDLKELSAKKIIIEYINKSNNDDTIDSGKYLGIVDLDFDFCFSSLQEVENLIYTDRNSMESYLIDIDLFKIFAKENELENIEVFETNFETYINNLSDFSIMFAVQLKYYEEFSSNLISFDDVPLHCPPFVKENEPYQICTDSIVQYKCDGDQSFWQRKYEEKKGDFIEMFSSCSTSILLLLHGKHTLKYLIGIFKRKYFNNLEKKFLINTLKDKFILFSKYRQYDLFTKVEQFALIS